MRQHADGDMTERALVRAIVLDETLEISDRVRQILSGLGVEVALVSSLSELDVMRVVGSRYDLLVANVTDPSRGSRIAEHLRSHRFDGRTLMLVDAPDAPELETLLAGALGLGPGRVGTPVSRYGIVGQSGAMRDICSRLDRVAAADVNVWLVGERGTERELIASAIHHASPRRHGPFVRLDCAAVPEGLMESRLFGHAEDAFTGAVDHRDGVLALADTGTLFFDELGESSLSMQAKLLRVVQCRQFVKVGGSTPIRSNIRLVCATNKDPQQAVEDGTLREALYFRMAIVVIRIPPLRERPEDIPLLVEHFVERSCAAHGKPIPWIDPEAMKRLVAEKWPGNVRQLENVVERAVVMTEGDALTVGDFLPNERAEADATRCRSDRAR